MTHPIHQVEQPPEVHNTLSNNSPKSSRTIPSNSHTSLVQAALLPFATILIWSFGLGSCLVGWLIAKRIPHPSGTSSHVFDGYLIVDEVNATSSEQTLNGQSIMKSNMRGVLIITAISNFSSIVTIPLMALGAFHVAAKWLDDQDQFNEGPTPLQFGLIMRMCSSGNWNSVFMTLRYLFRRWNADPPSARTKISPLVYRSLLITGLVVLLQYSRIVTDLLIKADLGSAYYSISTEVDIGSSLNASNLGTKYNPDNGYWEWLPKLLNQSQNFDPTTEWQILRWQGLETVIDRSDKNHIAMINTSNSSSIEDTSYMAVIVRPPSGLSSQWTWTAPTIGMTAQCQPALCNADVVYTAGRDTRTITCPSEKSIVPYHTIPLPTFDYMADLNNMSTNLFQNIRGYTVNGEMIKDTVTELDPQLPEQSNPSYFVMKLWLNDFNAWSRYKDLTELGGIEMDNVDDEESTWDSFALYVGACEVTLYHAMVSFDAFATTGANEGHWDGLSQYRLASPPIPMTKDETTQLFLPIFLAALRVANESDTAAMLSLLDSDIVPSLEAILVPDMIYPGFSTSVSYEFARQALAFIAGMNVTTIPAIAVADSEAKLVSRYPLGATMAYIGVVYAHGLLAIILFVGIFRQSSRTIDTDEDTRQGIWRDAEAAKKQESIQQLQLVQLRLTDPLAIVAEHFLGHDSKRQEISTAPIHARGLSTPRNVMDLFDAERPDTLRVEVGLIDRQEGKRRLGLRLRKNDALVTDAEKGG